MGAYIGRRGEFAILLVFVRLCACATPPLEIVQCLREIDYSCWSCWYHTTSVRVSRKLVSFRPVRPPPSPLFVVRVFGASCSNGGSNCVVGLLVIDSVGLDLQLETVCDCQGTLSLADERCFAFFVPMPVLGIESSIHRYPCASMSFDAGCNTKGYRALLTAKVPDNILILLSW